MKTWIRRAVGFVGACALIGSAAAATTQNVVSTVIGGGPNGLPGTDANVYQPYQTAVDASGNVYVAAAAQNRIFKITPSGTQSVVAGNGIAGYAGDGGPATSAKLYAPEGVAVDQSTPANVYIADFDNCLIRKVDGATGIISTIAGLVVTPTTGSPYTTCGYTGDTGRANAAEIYEPSSVAVNPANHDVYFTDYAEGVVRKIAGGVGTGTITTVAGTGQQNCQGSAPFGDTGSAKSAHLCNPEGVTLDTSVSPVNIFISEGNRCDIREVVGSSGDIFQVAGSYTLGCGFTDNVNALDAQLYNPWQTAVSVSGATTTVKVADYNNARIRQFTLTYKSGVPQPGTIKTIGGSGSGGFCNDAGPVTSACMNPVGLSYDTAGNAYIGDYGANRVRKVSKSNSQINTIMGWGTNGGTQVSYSDPVGLKGVGGTPSLYYPLGVFADPKSSKVYVGGYDGEAVYVWDSALNQISSLAGNGVGGFAGDSSAASSSATEVNSPIGIAKDSSGNVYIADSNNCAIREVSASSGNITTIAGGSPGALNGCGYLDSSAVDSRLYTPYGVAFDSKNNLYIADYSNCAIRKISASSKNMTTVAGTPTVGCGFSGDGGPATAAKIQHPDSIAIDGKDNVYFFDSNNYRVREILASNGTIQTVAGDGNYGNTGDGTAIGNSLTNGYVTVDPNGNIFISDTDSHQLRWVTPSGQLITFAGTLNSAGYSGDGGSATTALFYYPAQISRDGSGNTYVADEYNHRVRQITPFAGYGLSTAALNFETLPTATESNFQGVTVSAIGPTTISGISVSSGFSEIDDCVGQPLTAGQTCEIDVYFQPSVAGPATGKLTLSSNALFASNPNTVALTGTATGLALTGDLGFDPQALGTSTTHTLTLSNTGATLSLSKIYLTSTTNFSLSGGTCPTSGGSLAKGASCTLTVKYAPSATGAEKSTLVVLSNDSASPLLALVTGTGTEVVTSATSIAFGTIAKGTNKTVNLTVTNAGTASFTLSETISGSSFLISSTGKTCGASLAGGKSCVLPVEFAPTAAAASTGTLTLKTNGGSSPVITLSGTGK